MGNKASRFMDANGHLQQDGVEAVDTRATGGDEEGISGPYIHALLRYLAQQDAGFSDSSNDVTFMIHRRETSDLTLESLFRKTHGFVGGAPLKVEGKLRVPVGDSVIKFIEVSRASFGST